MVRVLDWLLGFLLVVFPPAAGLLLVIRAIQLRAWQHANRTWWYIWAPFVALAVVQAGVGRLQEAADLGAFTLLGFLAGLVTRPVIMKRVLVGIVSALPVLLMVVAIDAYSPYATWQVTRGADSVRSLPFSWLPLQQRIDAGQSQVELERQVISATAQNQLFLTAQATRTEAFYLSHTESSVVESAASARLEFPDQEFTSAYKAFRLRSQSVDSPVRLSIDLRATSGSIAAQGCRGPSLRTFDAFGEAQGTCQPSDVGTDWSEFTRTLSPSAGWDQPYVWAGLFDFGGHSLDVRSMRVEQYVDGSWLPLDEVKKSLIRVDYNGPDKTAEWLEVGSDLEQLSLSGPAQSVRLSIPMGTQVSLISSLGWGLGAIPGKRASAWFSHPNLLAHTSLALLLLIGVCKPSRRITFISAGLLLAVTVLTGSRIANVLGFLAAALLFFQMFRSSFARLLIVAAGLGWLAILWSVFPRLSPAAIFGGVGENAASRSEIWGIAWLAMIDNPLVGVGSGFADFFADAWDGPAFGVANHAHNFWLHFGSSYGVLGLLAAAALAVFLVVVTHTSRSVAAVTALLAILALNLVDSTLMTPGVLIPTCMIAGLAAGTLLHGKPRPTDV